MNEVIFLFVLALVWIVFASVQDLKKREVANWLNFSLIIFALGFRFFYCLFSEAGFSFLYQGLIGLGIFFVLGNLFYYCRLFAGGDAKLLIALGAVLPFSTEFFTNVKIFMWFFLIFLFIGAVYGFIWSLVLMSWNFKNFKKEFGKRFKKNKSLFLFVLFLALIIMGLGFVFNLFFYLGICIFVFPYFYLFAKSVDEVCMIKNIRTKDLVEGDWLYKNVKVGKQIVKARWEGLSKKEIKLLKKKRFVKVRQGIPFVPVFLISFIVLFYLWKIEFRVFGF